MSSISAGTTSGTALVSSGDTTGALVFQTNGTTTALTLNANQTATFVGAVTAPSFSGTSSTATNLAGGSNGTIPYQSAAGTTQMLAVGTAGQLLQTNGAGAPTWVTPSSGAVALISSVNIANVQTHNFTGLSGYYQYQLFVTAVSNTSVGNTAIRIQVGTGTAGTDSYYFGGVYSNGTSVASSERDSDTAFVPFFGVGDLSNSYSIQVTTDIFTAPSQNITFQSRANGYGSGNNTQTANMMGVWLGGSSMSSIHLNLGGTNFTGSIYLYGVKNA
jgi:hypothetical protein